MIIRRIADSPVLSERPAYREGVSGLIPLRVQNYIWENCYTSDGDSQLFFDCEAPVSPQEAAEIIDSISKNERLITELRYWMSTMRVALIMGNDRTKLAVQLRSIVNEMIDGKA